MQLRLTEEDKAKDPAYWSQPLWYRVYMRIFYALFAIIVTGAFFDLCTPAPMWIQLVLSFSVGAAVLLFRIAYPGGFSGSQEWLLDGMAQAQEEAEKKGRPYKGATSKEIRAELEKKQKENQDNKKKK